MVSSAFFLVTLLTLASAGHSESPHSRHSRLARLDNVEKRSLPSGWSVSHACVVDSSKRVIKDHQASSANNTPSSCIKSCEKAGFTLAGVQHSNECFCSKSFHGGSPKIAPKSDCNMPCAGDKSKKCGGGWRMTVYGKEKSSSSGGSPVTQPATSKQATATVIPEQPHTAVKPIATPAPPPSSLNKNVVAHFIMGNSYSYTKDTWLADIRLAHSKGIDAFALNLGADWWQRQHVADAYDAARDSGTGFKMFLSFDMTVMPCGSGNDASMVRDYIKTYYGHPAQLHVKGAPLVSTFNGQDCHFGQGSPNDGWASVVKNDMPPVQFVPAFFVGNPTNLRNFGVTNGIFSWDGSWARGPYRVNMDIDSNLMANNGGKTFMAAVSPWFYTHYSYKNWIYHGNDHQFSTRWEQLVANRNNIDVVQVISWNDFGESHYVGHITKDQPGSQAWVDGFDHTPWLEMIAYYAKAYKTGQYPKIETDQVFIWSRSHPAGANTGDPVGKPVGWDWEKDHLQAFVFSTGDASLKLTSGGNSQTFAIGQGIHKVVIENAPGTIRGTLSRNGQTVVDVAPSAEQFSYVQQPSKFNFNAYLAHGKST